MSGSRPICARPSLLKSKVPLPGHLLVERAEALQRERIDQAVVRGLLRGSLHRVTAARAAAEPRPDVTGNTVEIAAHGDGPAHGVHTVQVGLRPLGRGVIAERSPLYLLLGPV